MGILFFQFYFFIFFLFFIFSLLTLWHSIKIIYVLYLITKFFRASHGFATSMFKQCALYCTKYWFHNLKVLVDSSWRMSRRFMSLILTRIPKTGHSPNKEKVLCLGWERLLWIMYLVSQFKQRQLRDYYYMMYSITYDVPGLHKQYNFYIYYQKYFQPFLFW